MARCRACGAAIRWITLLSGSTAAIDPAPTPGGNILLNSRLGRGMVVSEDEAGPLYRNHLASCPFAAVLRKGRGRRTPRSV
jgi:hypothetical protein